MEHSLSWRQIVKKYNKADARKSNWQLGTTLFLYLLSWVAAYYAYQVSLWACLAVAMISQVFYGRLFIFMHDCGHGSFYKSKKARTFIGYLTGTLWFTPYWQWTKAHATHHRHSGNLEHRGIGDIWTLTVDEYKEASWSMKLRYRLARTPFFILAVGGFYVFFISQRLYTKEDGKREKKSVLLTNTFIILMALGISSVTSFEFYLFYQFFLLYLGASLSVFFFYVQHQYEDVYWSDTGSWNYETSALEGSSCLKLPKIVQYASGNIGFHHIHHLSHSIPNYNLEMAYKENPLFQKPTVLRLSDCYACFKLALIDRKENKMITFQEYSKKMKDSVQELNSLAQKKSLQA